MSDSLDFGPSPEHEARKPDCSEQGQAYRKGYDDGYRAGVIEGAVAAADAAAQVALSKIRKE
jgi:hypothetical protein